MIDDASRAPVIVLCTPRSGSTVFCAMLGQHPELYGFPELNLSVTETIGELWELSQSGGPTGIPCIAGPLRVIAEIEFGGQSLESLAQAKKWLGHRLDWSTRRMFDGLLSWVELRVGVDKSPRTALSQRSTRRAFASYLSSRVIHLTRHPMSTVRSLLDGHRNSEPSSITFTTVAWLANTYARLWVRWQEVILDSLEERGASRRHRISVETLLGETRRDVLARLVD